MNSEDFETLGKLAMKILCEQDRMDQFVVHGDNQPQEQQSPPQPQPQSQELSSTKSPLLDFKKELLYEMELALAHGPTDYMRRFIATALYHGIKSSCIREETRTADDYRNDKGAQAIISFCSNPYNCRSLAFYVVEELGQMIASFDMNKILMNTTMRTR